MQLQIGFNRRFDANFARVRQAVASGEIGTPSLMHIISRDPAPPPINYIRVSGGMFMDMMIHDFDMARFLIGDEVEEIYTAGGVRVDPEIGKAGDLDTALIVLRFRNGVIGTIDNSRKAVYGYDQRVEILGSEGKIATENRYPNQAVVSGGKSVLQRSAAEFLHGALHGEFCAGAQIICHRPCFEKRPTAGDRHRRPHSRGDGAGGAQVVRRAPAGSPRRGGGMKTIDADLHPHRRASVGARRCTDSGNHHF